jgi:hypothetical protein
MNTPSPKKLPIRRVSKVKRYAVNNLAFDKFKDTIESTREIIR